MKRGGKVTILGRWGKDFENLLTFGVIHSSFFVGYVEVWGVEADYTFLYLCHSSIIVQDGEDNGMEFLFSWGQGWKTIRS
jgi:hypothetical protein